MSHSCSAAANKQHASTCLLIKVWKDQSASQPAYHTFSLSIHRICRLSREAKTFYVIIAVKQVKQTLLQYVACTFSAIKLSFGSMKAQNGEVIILAVLHYPILRNPDLCHENQSQSSFSLCVNPQIKLATTNSSQCGHDVTKPPAPFCKSAQMTEPGN